MDDSNNCKMESILQNATDQQQTVTDKKNSQRLEKIAVSTNLQRKWKVLLPPLFQVRRRGSDRTQTALDECSCRHRFALNSILHFSHFQGQHNFEKNTPRETPLWIPPHVFSF